MLTLRPFLFVKIAIGWRGRTELSRAAWARCRPELGEGRVADACCQPWGQPCEIYRTLKLGSVNWWHWAGGEKGRLVVLQKYFHWQKCSARSKSYNNWAFICLLHKSNLKGKMIINFEGFLNFHHSLIPTMSSKYTLYSPIGTRTEWTKMIE